MNKLGKSILKGCFVMGMIGVISAPVFASGGSLSGSKAVSTGDGMYLSKTVYNHNVSPGSKVYASAWMASSLGKVYGKRTKLGVNGSVSVTSTEAIAAGYHGHSGGLRSDDVLYDPDAVMVRAL